MAGIKAFLIFSVAAFDFAVVARGIGTDELVADTELRGGAFKEGGKVTLGVGETVGERKAVISLDAFHASAGATVLSCQEQDSCGAYPGSASAPLLCAGWDGCEAAGTGRPERPLFHPTELSRSRCTTGSCCTSGWPGSRHISPHISSGIADMPCPVLYFCS